jgi:CRP-like cAMP-binding protein
MRHEAFRPWTVLFDDRAAQTRGLRLPVDASVGLTISDIFEGLAPETLRDFESLGRKQSYPRGASLFATGDVCTGIFWLSRGGVNIAAHDNRGRCRISRVAHVGELLGLKAAICNEPHGNTARSERPSEVNFVSRADFSSFLARHPDAAFRIVQELSHRIDVTLDRLRSIASSPQSKPPN